MEKQFQEKKLKDTATYTDEGNYKYWEDEASTVASNPDLVKQYFSPKTALVRKECHHPEQSILINYPNSAADSSFIPPIDLLQCC